MAARRLLIVMLLLLGLSALAASQLPQRDLREGTTTDTTTEATETQPTETPPRGELLSYEITVGGPKTPVRVIEIRVGDQISLQVHSRRQTQVDVPAFGLIEVAAPGAPARFELLAAEPGSYGVRILGGRVAARIEVSAGDGVRSRARGGSD